MAIIRASEVNEYLFCARAWWLRRVAGLEPAGHQRRAAGEVLHTRHGGMVNASNGVLLLAGGLLFLALIALILGLITLL
jgi:CRISPR/Cas system-associated exonuclease Cas4 (RecB family)